MYIKGGGRERLSVCASGLSELRASEVSVCICLEWCNVTVSESAPLISGNVLSR